MNTETGQIEIIEGTDEQIRSILRRDGAPKYIPVKRLAATWCKRCNGTGSRRRGTKSRGMWIPCRCVL